jgi:hypothetical protein
MAVSVVGPPAYEYVEFVNDNSPAAGVVTVDYDLSTAGLRQGFNAVVVYLGERSTVYKETQVVSCSLCPGLTQRVTNSGLYEAGAPHFDAYVFPFWFDGANAPTSFTITLNQRGGALGAGGGYLGPIDVYRGIKPTPADFPPQV